VRTFDNIYDLLNDMRDYARAHPKHEFLCADDPDSHAIGWIAFEHGSPEDVRWSIPVKLVRWQFRRGDDNPNKLLTSNEGKIRFLLKLVQDARSALPGRTLWERLLGEDPC
jgi:hypothetical protein